MHKINRFELYYFFDKTIRTVLVHMKLWNYREADNLSYFLLLTISMFKSQFRTPPLKKGLELD